MADKKEKKKRRGIRVVNRITQDEVAFIDVALPRGLDKVEEGMWIKMGVDYRTEQVDD